MNTFIAKVINESRNEQLPTLSLEKEVELIFLSESYRQELEYDLNDASRTIDLTDALEGLAIVAQEITEPTPEQAALIQIAGDLTTAGSGMDGAEITPSLEDIQSDMRDTGAAISSKVKAAIETIIRAIKDLLARIGGVVRKYLQAIRAAVGGHVQRLKVIKERLAQSNFPLNAGDDFMMSMPVVGTTIIRKLPELLKQATTFNVAIDAFVKYANDFNINYSSGMTDLYSKLSESKLDIVEQFSLISKIAQMTSGRVSGRMTTSSNVEPNMDYFDVKHFYSEDLLGGVSIVQTTALMKANPKDLSSASIREAIEELSSNVKIRVTLDHLGFGREDCSVKPFTKPEIEQAIKVCESLIEHFTGKSEHASLSIAAARRLDLAEKAVEHITKYIEKFDRSNIAAKEYSNAALHVTNSIIRNATSPYSNLTTSLNRCITLLTNAILKSLNAHELYHRQIHLNKAHAASMQHKAATP